VTCDNWQITWWWKITWNMCIVIFCHGTCFFCWGISVKLAVTIFTSLFSDMSPNLLNLFSNFFKMCLWTKKNSSTSVRLGFRICFKLTLFYTLNSSHVSCVHFRFGNIFGSGCLCLNYAWFTHSSLCQSLLSEGVVSVQLTKCQLTFMDASFWNNMNVWKNFNSCGVLVFLLICCYPICTKRAHLHLLVVEYVLWKIWVVFQTTVEIGFFWNAFGNISL